ncbi:MAG: RAD55 family ATPase [Thermoplasmata archaeon]
MEIERIKSGITGLDEILGGGIPKGHTVSVIGPFGTGKTTLAMQFINQGLLENENCFYLSLEEESESLMKTAEIFGFNFKKYYDEGKLKIFRLSPSDASDISSRIKEITEEFRENEIKRLVLDSASLLTMVFREDQDKRNVLFTLSKGLKDSGITSIFTGEIDLSNRQSSRDGLLEYVSDGVILLDMRKNDKNTETYLTIQVLKMRKIPHSRKIYPFEIKENGIEVQSEITLL